MQQIYRRTPIPKSDFNKVSKKLYWNPTFAWVFSCKFAVYRKIPLIRSGCIYGQRTNLMGLYSGGGMGTHMLGGLIFGRKNTSICNLSNLLLLFLFSRFCNNQHPQIVRITFIKWRSKKDKLRWRFPDSWKHQDVDLCINTSPFTFQ